MTDWLPSMGLVTGLGAAILMLGLLSGWRAGFARVAFIWLGIVMGWVFAGNFSPALALHLQDLTNLPAQFLVPPAFAIIVLSCAVWSFLLGLIFLKRTANQSLAPLRWLYGLGGLILALPVALFLSLCWLSGVRMSTQVAAVGLEVTANEATELPNEARLKNLASLGRELDGSPWGVALDRLDPLPESWRNGILLAARVYFSPGALQRMAADPKMQELVVHAGLEKLLRDPGFAKRVQAQDWPGLLREPALKSLLADPEFHRALGQVDFEEWIRDATRPTPPSEP